MYIFLRSHLKSEFTNQNIMGNSHLSINRNSRTANQSNPNSLLTPEEDTVHINLHLYTHKDYDGNVYE